MNRRISGPFAALLLSTFIFGCSGGGGDEPAATSGPAPATISSGPWNERSVAATFDADRANSIANSSRFRGVNGNLPDGMSNASHPFELARLQWALSGNWDGTGQLVAVVDDGFRVSHQEFSDAEVTTFGDVSVAADSSHGTHVAALVAGSDAVGRMMGVAPGADLHLTSYLKDTTRSSIDLDKLADATRASAALGAVAQNNSWGVLMSEPDGSDRELLLSDVRGEMAAGRTVSQAYANLVGGTAARWQDYFASLNAFQAEGVIVWAMSNDETLTENDASSALPLLAPDLTEAWIAVGNGEFSVNSNYEITDARRLSAACGEMARSCLFADGTTLSASAESNTSYSAGTGTSFAAPQVSGAIAIMAQAFPGLSPEEWTKRLLASAYSDFSDFEVDGRRDFGNGVVKAFSDEWGMGVLDIAAALSPIDGVSLVNGRSLSAATHSEVAASAITSGTASGDATRALLEDVEIAVFDALDTPFPVPASVFSATIEPDLARAEALPRIGAGSLAETVVSSGAGEAAIETALADDTYALKFSALGGADTLASSMGTGSETVDTSMVGTLADEATGLVGSLDMGPVVFEHYSFAGRHSSIENGSVVGLGGGAVLDLDPVALKVAVLQTAEQGGMLGMSGAGNFSVPDSAALTSIALSGEIDIAPGTSVFGGLERGLAHGSAGEGYVDGLDGLAFSSFQVGVRTESLITETDALSVSVSQPLRVDEGTLTLTVPAGRTADGAIVSREHTGSLAPSGRQLDLGLNYSFAPDENTEIEFGAVYSHDLGHVAGDTGAAFGVDFSRTF